MTGLCTGTQFPTVSAEEILHRMIPSITNGLSRLETETVDLMKGSTLSVYCIKLYKTKLASYDVASRLWRTGSPERSFLKRIFMGAFSGGEIHLLRRLRREGSS